MIFVQKVVFKSNSKLYKFIKLLLVHVTVCSHANINSKDENQSRHGHQLLPLLISRKLGLECS